VFFVENYIDCLLNNNNKQTILQYNSNNKDITINNIKIIAKNSRQECVLTKLKIINFNNIVNININYINALVNCVL